MTQETQQEPSSASESTQTSPKKRDHSFRIGVFCAILGAIVGAVASFAVPQIWSWYQNSKTTKVTITAPANRTQQATNGFGASGYIQGPSPGPSHELWLIVYSDDQYFPFSKLNIVDDQWNIPAREICTAVGFQTILVYEVPTKDSGGLWAYAQDGTKHLDAMPGSLPRTAVLKASTNVEVSKLVC